MKKSINIKNAPDPVGPYSQAIIHNNIMYASGQIAIDPKSGLLINDDVEKELHQILINIDALLEAAQISRKNILKCSIFLKNMCCKENNTRCGARTHDHTIKSRALYRLS